MTLPNPYQFPAAIDDLTDPALSSGPLGPASTEAQVQAYLNFANLRANFLSGILALELKVGADGSADPTSLDYKVARRTRALFAHFADAGNLTTAETDLYSDSVPAGQLAADGDRLAAEYAGTFVGHATATRRLKAYFGGTAVFDTGALAISANAAWVLSLSIWRKDAATVRYAAGLTTQSAPAAAYTACGELGGLTLANALVLKVTGTAAAAGAASNDVVAKAGAVTYLAAP